MSSDIIEKLFICSLLWLGNFDSRKSVQVKKKSKFDEKNKLESESWICYSGTFDGKEESSYYLT